MVICCTCGKRWEGPPYDCPKCEPKVEAAPADRMVRLLTHFYNAGYRAGHEDTVESVYTDIADADVETEHQDIVRELHKELEEA